MECRRVCHVNGAAGHCRLVEGIPLLQLGEDVKNCRGEFIRLIIQLANKFAPTSEG